MLATALTACGPAAPTSPIRSMGEDMIVQDAASAALKAGKAGAPLRTLQVLVRMTESYGGQAVAPGATFSWTAADLARVQWRGVTALQLIDLAQLRFDGREGVHGVAVWCADADSKILTPRLCGDTFAAAAATYMGAPSSR